MSGCSTMEHPHTSQQMCITAGTHSRPQAWLYLTSSSGTIILASIYHSPDLTKLDKTLWNIIKRQMSVGCCCVWGALEQGFTTSMPEFCTGSGPNRPVKETDANERSHCHTGQPSNMWWVMFKLHYKMQIVISLKYKISVKVIEQIACSSVKRTIKQDTVLRQVLSKECVMWQFLSKSNSSFVNAGKYNLKLKRLKLFARQHSVVTHHLPESLCTKGLWHAQTDCYGRLGRGMGTSWLTCSYNSPHSMNCAINQTELTKHWCFVLKSVYRSWSVSHASVKLHTLFQHTYYNLPLQWHSQLQFPIINFFKAQYAADLINTNTKSSTPKSIQ